MNCNVIKILLLILFFYIQYKKRAVDNFCFFKFYFMLLPFFISRGFFFVVSLFLKFNFVSEKLDECSVMQLT